jgi:hypothetical protein
MAGIVGLTKGIERARRLPIIGKLRKGAARTEEDIAKKRPGHDLEWFRLTSDEPGLEKLFAELFGADPAIITGVLPLATVDEVFPTRCEGRDKGGFLEHACDGEWCSIWRDDKGVYHYAAPGEQGPPCPGGCKAIGRLYLEIPELQQHGYSGWIVAETKAKNDIPVIYDALSIIAEKRAGTLLGLRGVPVLLRRVPAMIPTPRPDGSKRRQEKWLLQLLESPEWAARQAALARADRVPGANPRQEPDWEEVNHPGRTVAEVERDEFLVSEPDAENGNGAAAAEPPAVDPAEERKLQAKALWAQVFGAARAAGWQKGAGELLAQMGYLGLLQVLDVAAQHSATAVLNQALDVVFPWPAELITAALATLPYYRATPHVVNALNLSGLPRTRDQAELLDWLASHARERQAEQAEAGLVPPEPWDEEVAL